MHLSPSRLLSTLSLNQDLALTHFVTSVFTNRPAPHTTIRSQPRRTVSLGPRAASSCAGRVTNQRQRHRRTNTHIKGYAAPPPPVPRRRQSPPLLLSPILLFSSEAEYIVLVGHKLPSYITLFGTPFFIICCIPVILRTLFLKSGIFAGQHLGWAHGPLNYIGPWWGHLWSWPGSYSYALGHLGKVFSAVVATVAVVIAVPPLPPPCRWRTAGALPVSLAASLATSPRCGSRGAPRCTQAVRKLFRIL